MKATLVTNRLILRPWKRFDAKAMFFGWAKDPEVTKYLTWNPHENLKETKSHIKEWLRQYKKKERINFAITLKSNKALIGSIEVIDYIDEPDELPVIGYALAKEYWNNGYMSEALQAVLDFLLSLGHHEITIDAAEGNLASIRVIEKCGGVYVSSHEEVWPLKEQKVMVKRFVIRKD